MVVWPGGGGPVCHSSEVRRWNVTSNGNLMTKEMRVIDTYLFCWVEMLKKKKRASLSAWRVAFWDFVNP